MSRTSISTIATRTIARTSIAVLASTAFLATPASAAPTSHGYPGEEPFSRQCFMLQSNWNDALDGPQPQCPGPESEHSGDPDPLQGAEKLRHPHG